MRRSLTCALILFVVTLSGIVGYELLDQAPWWLLRFHGYTIAFAAFAILYIFRVVPLCSVTDFIFAVGSLVLCFWFGLALYHSLRDAPSAFNLLLPFGSIGSALLPLLVVRRLLHPERNPITAA